MKLLQIEIQEIFKYQCRTVEELSGQSDVPESKQNELLYNMQMSNQDIQLLMS